MKKTIAIDELADMVANGCNNGELVVKIDDESIECHTKAAETVPFLCEVMSIVWEMFNEVNLSYQTAKDIIDLGCVKFLLSVRDEKNEGIEDIVDHLNARDPLTSTMEVLSKDFNAEAKKAETNRKKAEKASEKVKKPAEKKMDSKQFIEDITKFLKDKGYDVGNVTEIKL